MKSTQRKRRKAFVVQSICAACGCCVKVCPVNAIKIFCGLYALIDQGKCAGCGRCAAECPASVISLQEVEA